MTRRQNAIEYLRGAKIYITEDPELITAICRLANLLWRAPEKTNMGIEEGLKSCQNQ